MFMDVPNAQDSMRTVTDTFKQHLCYCSDLKVDSNSIAKHVSSLSGKFEKDQPFVLLCGNIADSFETCEKFLNSLVSTIDPKKIVLFPGESELAPCRDGKTDYAGLMEKYREMVEGLGCAFLETQVLILKNGFRNIYEASDLLNASKADLREEVEGSQLVVFGYSSYGGKKEEMRKLYDHLSRNIPECSMVVVSDSFDVDYNFNWTYITRDPENSDRGMRIFSDTSDSVRRFEMPSVQRAPYGLKDGNTRIEADGYRKICADMGMPTEYNIGKDVTIVTENGYSIFLTQVKVFTTTVLDISSPFKHEHSWDYFRDNIVQYTGNAIRLFEPFYRRLREVSQYVRMIGGTGLIDGCTVNVDEDLNIFVDPVDMSLTLYRTIKGGFDFLSEFEMTEFGDYPTNMASVPGMHELLALKQIDKEPPAYLTRRNLRKMMQITDCFISVVDRGIVRRWDDRMLQEGTTLAELITNMEDE